MNFPAQRVGRASGSSEAAWDGSNNGSGGSSGSCSGAHAVNPDWDWMQDGSGRFEVCRGSSNGNTLEIHGSTRYGNQICVFPAVQNGNQLQVFNGGGGVLRACGSPGSNGVSVSLPGGISFNSVFIVEKSFENQMANCLAAGNYALCPSSYGQSYFSFGAL